MCMYNVNYPLDLKVCIKIYFCERDYIWMNPGQYAWLDKGLGKYSKGEGGIRRLEHCREGVVILHGLKVFSNSKRLFNLEVSVTIHSSSF